jgi:PleD family two-component response regulator
MRSVGLRCQLAASFTVSTADRIMEHLGAAAPLRILVVDDDYFVREALGYALETMGYDVGYASDGRSALNAVARHRPEAIVTERAAARA